MFPEGRPKSVLLTLRWRNNDEHHFNQWHNRRRGALKPIHYL